MGVILGERSNYSRCTETSNPLLPSHAMLILAKLLSIQQRPIVYTGVDGVDKEFDE